MKLPFMRNAKRNAIAALANNAVRLVFPFLNRTLFLWLLGPEYLGLNGLFGSVLGVLMLAELGFGTAVVCSMYKPGAENDRALLCAYLKFYRTVYRCVGTAIFAVGLALLPFLRNLVHGDVPPDVDLHILYIIHLVNTSASYFLFAYRGAVLNAHQRNDVVSNIRTAVSVAQYIAVFLILLVTRNYYHYVLATVAFTVVQNLLLVRSSRRLFPDIEPRGELPADQRRRVVSDVKSIFLHKVGGVISHSSDNLVISSMLGLVAVAAYGNYYYVVTSVAGLVSAICTSTQGGFGNRIYLETRRRNFELFMKTDRLAMTVVVWCAAMMCALYAPFIEIWTKGDPTLERHALTPVLMVLYFLVNQSRQALLTFKAAASLWREDRMKPVVAGAVNLAVSIALVLLLPDDFKLDGVIFGTILSYAAVQVPWEAHVVFTKFFGRNESRAYWREQLRFAAIAIVLCAATWLAAFAVPLEGFAGLAAKGVASALVSCSIVGLIFRGDIRDIYLKRKRI